MSPQEPRNQTPVKPDATRPEDASTSVQNTQPEDAYNSGGEHKQQRRELELNVQGQGGQGQQHPEKPAGIHSTGSFTGTAEKPEIPSE